MCIQIKTHYEHSVCRLAVVVGLMITPFLSQAQSEPFINVETQLQPSMPMEDQELLNEIDKVLGMTESKIKKGIVDPGVDLVGLAVNKALDEMIKAIADAVVVAPAAEKIMSIYQKTKDKRLVEKLASLREVWKDGQERINKLNYQNFKLRYEWATQHNEENKAIKSSSIKGLSNKMAKDIWGTEVAVIQDIYDKGGKSTGDRLAKQYINKGREDFPYYNLSILMTLGGTDLIKARDAFSVSKGKSIFLSPYERLKLQQKSLAEAKERHTDLVQYGSQVSASMNYYRMAESEQAQRSMLSKKISDPYMVHFTKK